MSWSLLSQSSPLLDRLRSPSYQHIQRVPSPQDHQRWIEHMIGGNRYRVATPITFTPYASVRACSARCHFCSETLRPVHGGTAASRLRPAANYFAALDGALDQLHGLPISYSLSGLEMTDDSRWFMTLLEHLGAAADNGVTVHDRVLYSNGAGFAHSDSAALFYAIEAFALSWVELSRHHFDAVINQQIMRFRPDEAISDNDHFQTAARKLSQCTSLRFVCITQKNGICNAGDVRDYLQWAQSLGADTVIFREFSKLGGLYRDNNSHRYIDTQRVPIDWLIDDFMNSALGNSMAITHITDGYYFSNVRMRHSSGINVVFESSDYSTMHQRHASGDLYKLVLHANGRLCAGWSPDHDILWEYRDD